MTFGFLARAAATTLRISVPTLAEAAFGRLEPDVCDVRLEQWSRRLLQQAQVDLVVRGLSNANSDESFVVMSNHQSHYDIPVLFQALPRRIRMVAKQELFRVPLWGRAMRVAGFIEVDREHHERAVESMRRAAAAIQSGTDIWIAPEGTRSKDGSLQSFRKGGFHLALDAAVQILPVSIDGTHRVLAATGWSVHPGVKVTVTLHPPVDSRDYSVDSLEALMDRVRDAIKRGLPNEATGA